MLQLTDRFSGSGRNICMDRYFSSHEPFVNLLECNLTVSGTIQSNRRDVPDVLKATRGREKFSCLFLWDHENRIIMLIFYIQKRNKHFC